MAVSPEFIFNPDSQQLEPVTIRSRIRAGSGEAVALKSDFDAGVIPGNAWEASIAISGKRLIDRGRAAQFEVSIEKPMNLAQCQALLLQRVSVPLRVTLTPDIALPLPGVPVPVETSVPPKTSTVSVRIPEIIPGRIDLDTDVLDPDGAGNPRCSLRAQVVYPPFLHPTPDEEESVAKTVKFTEGSGHSAVTPGAVTRDTAGWTCKEYTALANSDTMEGARVMVEVTAQVCGILLKVITQLSFSPRVVYQPYIVPKTLNVDKLHPGFFTATLRAVDPEGVEIPVPDAEISVSIPADGRGVVTLSPLSAKGTLTATVTTPETRKEQAISCPVVFTAGQDRYEDSVLVRIGRQDPGTLEVLFEPADKILIDPFAGNDTLTLKARVLYPPGTTPPVSPAVITFAREAGALWLDEPSMTVPLPDGGVAAAIGASPPDPESRASPPVSENIIVQAEEGGRVIARKKVPIGFVSPSMLDLSPDTVRLISRGEDVASSVPVKMKDTVTLSVAGGHPGPWTFELIRGEEEELPFKVSPAGGDPTSARFTLTLDGELPEPESRTGPGSWQHRYILHTRASAGRIVIDGPDLAVFILREGLFVDKIYAVNEQNEYKTSGDLTVLPIRVDTPDKDRRRTARVRFVALVWNGSDLVEDKDAVKGKNLAWDEPVCTDGDCQKWKTVFSVLDASLVCSDEDEPAATAYFYLSGTWGVSLDMIIPGAGERLKGEVEVLSKAGSVKVPLVLIFGEPPDEKTLAIAKEKARCERLINGCIPKPYRQKLLDDLEKLPSKGAKDYQEYSRQVYETAWKIWAEDQKDYQYWENGWGYYAFKGAEYAKGAGDIAFTLCIGYATSAMGPAWSYFASTMVSECKDQGLECYAYYVENKDTKDFRTCVIDFVHENFYEFFIRLSSGAVDAVILQGFDIKNPKTYTRLAWLWLWKFEQNLARNPDAGIIEAMIAAGKEVAMVPPMMLLQEFVNVHGNSKLKDLHRSVQEKGYLGGKVPGTPEEPGSRKEEKTPSKEKKPGDDGTAKPEKTAPEKTQKEKYQKGIKEAKEQAKKTADKEIEKGRGTADPESVRAFEEGRQAGREKVDRLAEAAEAVRKNPHDGKAREEFGKVAEEVQTDKHAMHELNDRNTGKQDPVREQFNEFWKGKYEKVDRPTKQRIADKLNENLRPGEKPFTADDIEVAGVTNTPPKSAAEDSVKSTYDRDVTYRNKRTGKDVPTEISKDIYHEEFYREMHHGKLPMTNENGKMVVDRAAVDHYAEHCDQTVTDRFHADAYGGGKEDIPPAVDPNYRGKPFKDIGATAQTMEYKVLEWYKRAGEAAKAGDPARAEACKEEAMRQLTKQFKNQVEGRVDKMNEITGYGEPPIAKVPDDLRAAVEVMNRVGTKGKDGKVFTSAEAEAVLNKMGTSPQKVVSQMSGTIESLQKNTPPGARKAVEDHVRTLTDEARDQRAFQDRIKTLKDRLKEKRGGKT